jgi:hypothetical protein
MVSPSLGVSVYYCKQTPRSASADAFRQMFVCLFKATVPSSRPGIFWAVARKSGQIRRIAAGPEARAAPLGGEHGEDPQFDRAEHDAMLRQSRGQPCYGCLKPSVRHPA